MDMDSDLGVTGNSSQKFSLLKKVIYKPDKHFVKIKVRTGLRGELSLLYNQCLSSVQLSDDEISEHQFEDL